MSLYPFKRFETEQLIGLKFKRKKYGPSFWTDTIRKVQIYLVYNPTFKEYCPTCVVYGENTNISYDIDEIMIMDVDRERRDELEKRWSGYLRDHKENQARTE